MKRLHARLKAAMHDPIIAGTGFGLGLFVLLWQADVHGQGGSLEGGYTDTPMLINVEGKTFFCGNGYTWAWEGTKGQVRFRDCRPYSLPFADGFE